MNNDINAAIRFLVLKGICAVNFINKYFKFECNIVNLFGKIQLLFVTICDRKRQECILLFEDKIYVFDSKLRCALCSR
jgi:hypothetical protein